MRIHQDSLDTSYPHSESRQLDTQHQSNECPRSILPEVNIVLSRPDLEFHTYRDLQQQTEAPVLNTTQMFAISRRQIQEL